MTSNEPGQGVTPVEEEPQTAGESTKAQRAAAEQEVAAHDMEKGTAAPLAEEEKEEPPQEPGSAEIGVVGMAVMGSSLARNVARHGYRVAIFNRTYSKTQQVMADHGSEGEFVPAEQVEQFVASLRRPRKALIMVRAGTGTDATIDELLPHLEPGDILIDGGNASFEDTRRGRPGSASWAFTSSGPAFPAARSGR